MNTLSPVQNPANQAGAYNAPQARRVEQYAGQTGATPEISVVIPVFNEEDNVELLYSKLVSALTELGRSWEAILVDDGSKDKSFKKLEAIASGDSRIKVVRFVKNFGQTAALAAGIDHASGDVIIPMDADLQNDPADIKRLLAKLDEGFDVVSGWRKERKDELFLRLIPSWIANKIISVISGVRLHDYGCSLKAYRKEVIKDVRLYGEMHRFVPIYATWLGAAVAEIPVDHHARQFGQSKYGISRTFKVVLDLMTVKFMSTYLTKPIYVFGTAGLWSMVMAMAAFVWMVVLKLCYHTSFIETPLPVLVAVLFVMGMQLIFMGLQSEILMRTYHESQGKRIYRVKTLLNVQDQNQ
ncbi:MAG: glycosyltransferase family 2 protein [Candidatus Melainabacteria bacterium]|jgi:glycosyltransferase involved in cell wall biosynthesis|nr:glycosyltransferase family 2 protein [Candidatus Melainabacteria bacterium]MBX9673279.1 glycosyltransferase family 2 protein [Candidatus Obscuribacterales bacterium]